MQWRQLIPHNPWLRGCLIGASILSGILTLLVILVIAFFFKDQWEYDYVQAQIPVEMARAGFFKIPDTKANDAHPDLSSTSPDGQWTITAHWANASGYNWGLKNKAGGPDYFRQKKIEYDSAFAPAISFLWSPDSRFFVCSEAWDKNFGGIRIFSVAGKEPKRIHAPTPAFTFTAGLLKPGDDAPILIPYEPPSNDLTNGEMALRSQAVAWINATDLQVIVFFEKATGYLGGDGPMVAICARRTVHVTENSYAVTPSTTYDFYRRFYDEP